MSKILYQIAQLSDCHLFSDKDKDLLGVKTHESLSAVIEIVKSHRPIPDIFIVSGDLSQDFSEQSYQYLIEFFKPFEKPFYAIPGNHDSPEFMSKIFKNKSIILNQWQIILLDSQKLGSVEGFLDVEELTFLEDTLKKNQALDSIIFFHHPPVLIGSFWIDPLGLTNAEDFWNIVKQYPTVKAVFFGHAHQEFVGEKNGIACYGVPSTCIQFKPYSEEFTLDHVPPGYRWIELYSNGTLKTEVRRVKHYIGTFEADSKGYK